MGQSTWYYRYLPGSILPTASLRLSCRESGSTQTRLIRHHHDTPIVLHIYDSSSVYRAGWHMPVEKNSLANKSIKGLEPSWCWISRLFCGTNVVIPWRISSRLHAPTYVKSQGIAIQLGKLVSRSCFGWFCLIDFLTHGQPLQRTTPTGVLLKPGRPTFSSADQKKKRQRKIPFFWNYLDGSLDTLKSALTTLFSALSTPPRPCMFLAFFFLPWPNLDIPTRLNGRAGAIFASSFPFSLALVAPGVCASGSALGG